MNRYSSRTSFLSAVIGMVMAANATAQTVINTDFTTSATLTLANSPYQLDGDIYVLPGATLTIEAGVRFASTSNSTLAITRGAQIIANGTKDAPIVFTSVNDTGVYRQLANNEWGNLTIMGSGYISEDEIPSNSSSPASTNYADMEGLTPANPANNDYGGGNDIDQGWRGKAQFGLIVQGLSNTGAQGSGFGDNAMEIDGAERCDWQPVTTCALHNWTVIGGENDAAGGAPTDELVEFRDNARVQFLNCIFMDAGKEVVNDKVTDGEANNNTTVCGPASSVPQLLSRMTTSAGTTFGLNAFPGSPESTPAQAYTAQDPTGNLVQFRGCIYYNNDAPTAYPEALSYGLFPSVPVPGTNHANNDIVTTMPIAARTRGAAVVATGHAINPVTFLDPTPVGVATSAAEFSPNDGFFTPARFTGAFARGNNWLIGWTGTSQFGLTSNSQANNPITGVERGGVQGVPVHYTDGDWTPGSSVTIACENLADVGGLSVGVLVFGAGQVNVPVFGGVVVPTPTVIYVVTGAPGSVAFNTFTMPGGLSGQTFYTQFLAFDPGVPANEFVFSNAQRHIVP